MAHPGGARDSEDGAPSRVRTKDPRETGGGLKPLLASEALMEDLAPVEPSRAVARWVVVAVGSVLAALGLLPVFGVSRGGLHAAWACFGMGGIALMAGLLPVSYRARAFAMLVLGILGLALGAMGLGPASGLGLDGLGWAVARIAAGALLPAALIFRSRYRAYSVARWLLAAAVASALPFAVRAGMALAQSDQVALQAASGLTLLALLASLTGFMGAETTGAAALTAGAILTTVALELGVRAFPPGADWLAAALVAATVLAYAAFALLLALGTFQQLAAHLAPAARAIDLHRPPAEPPRPPPSSPDWLAGG